MRARTLLSADRFAPDVGVILEDHRAELQNAKVIHIIPVDIRRRGALTQ